MLDVKQCEFLISLPVVMRDWTSLSDDSQSKISPTFESFVVNRSWV